MTDEKIVRWPVTMLHQYTMIRKELDAGRDVGLFDVDGTVRMVISHPAPDPAADPLAEPSVAVSALRELADRYGHDFGMANDLRALIREAEEETRDVRVMDEATAEGGWKSWEQVRKELDAEAEEGHDAAD